MEIIVINTQADWTCSGKSSIAAAFRGGLGFEPDMSPKAAPPLRKRSASVAADGGAQRSAATAAPTDFSVSQK
jgi:hypothetical protein